MRVMELEGVLDIPELSGEVNAYAEIIEMDYDAAKNKPSINGVELIGNKTTEELGIEAGVVSWNGQTGTVTFSESDPTVPSWAKQSTKPSYTAQEVGALPADTVIPVVPEDVSAFNNDAGYLTAETDPTVPSWAKASSKPSYTASEVGALPDTYVAPVLSVNSKTGAVVLDASDVGAIPDTTTFALGYDPDCSVGLAEVGSAVTHDPNYTPSGDIQQTLEELKLMTGGTAELTASFYNGTLTLGVSLTPTTATKNVATSAPVFNGNGVHFVIKEDNL